MSRRRVAALVALLTVIPAGTAAAAPKNPPIGSKQANRIVAKQLADAHFVGARGDGASVDWVFCADGRYSSAVTSYGTTGSSDGQGWKVIDARVRNGGTWFEAIVEDTKDGWSVAVGRRGDRWLGAVSRTPYKWGAVTRTAAGAACA
jgi:hypothetical protein